MLKRVFFSVKLDTVTIKEISRHQEEIKKLFEQEVKWVNTNNLHITLHFVGSIKESGIEDLINKAGAIRHSPFTVNFFKLTYFPKDKKDAKLIWIEGECKEMEELIDKIQEKIYIKKEKSLFKPHITLGRVKKWELKKRSFFDIPDISEDININMKTDRFYLTESILKKTGPEYKTLKEFLLK